MTAQMEQDSFDIETSPEDPLGVPAPEPADTSYEASPSVRSSNTFPPGERYVLFLRAWGTRPVYVEVADPPLLPAHQGNYYLRVKFYRPGEGYPPTVGMVDLSEIWMMQPWDTLRMDAQAYIAQRPVGGR